MQIEQKINSIGPLLLPLLKICDLVQTVISLLAQTVPWLAASHPEAFLDNQFLVVMT